MSIQNTADEMMTIAAARELKDGAVVGISLPVDGHDVRGQRTPDKAAAARIASARQGAWSVPLWRQLRATASGQAS